MRYLACVIFGPTTAIRFDGPESGDLWGLSTEDEVLVRPPTTSMAFEDFVQLLKAKDIQETFYLEYLAVHQYLGEQLQVRGDVYATPFAGACGK